MRAWLYLLSFFAMLFGGSYAYAGPIGFGGGSSLLSHATDCPANAQGAFLQQCVDLDDGKLWTCASPAGGVSPSVCDAAGEWVLNSSSSDTGVDSFETRTGSVSSVAGDYTATEITNTPAGAIAAITVQAAITELDTEKSGTTHTHTAATLDTDSVSADELNATGVETELEAVLDLNQLQGSVTDGQVPDTLTASNYLPLAGGALTGEATVDDLGLQFTPGDTLTDCSTFSATGGGIFYDDSEGVFKKCQDNVLTTLDTGGGGGDNVSVDGVAVVDPNLASTGDIDVVDTANVITFNINAGVVSAAELDETGVETGLEAVLDLDQLQGQIADGQIAAGAVDGGNAGEIADASVTSDDLGTDSVSADELNATGVEAELEAVLDLDALQGSVTDGQVPDTLTMTDEVYDATGWNGDTAGPQKDDIRDYLESWAPAGVPATASDLTCTDCIGATEIVNGSTTVIGVVELATDGEVAANVVVQGNDTRLSPERIITTPQDVTCTDSGNGSPGALTLTPDAYNINLTVADAEGCTVTMSETGAFDGQQILIRNVNTPSATFATSAGVLTLRFTPRVLASGAHLTLTYANSAWEEDAFSLGTAISETQLESQTGSSIVTLADAYTIGQLFPTGQRKITDACSEASSFEVSCIGASTVGLRTWGDETLGLIQESITPGPIAVHIANNESYCFKTSDGAANIMCLDEATTSITSADATTTKKGVVELATSGENAANIVVQGNDARLTYQHLLWFRMNEAAGTTDDDFFGASSGGGTPCATDVLTGGCVYIAPNAYAKERLCCLAEGVLATTTNLLTFRVAGADTALTIADITTAQQCTTGTVAVSAAQRIAIRQQESGTGGDGSIFYCSLELGF